MQVVTHTLAIIMLSMIAGVLRAQNPGNLSFGTPAYAASGVYFVTVRSPEGFRILRFVKI